MTDDVQSTLESTGGVRVDVGVVGDTDSTGADGSNVETKVRAVQRQETRVYINFKMAACLDMALPVSLVLDNLPAQHIFVLDVALGVAVGVPTVLEHVSPLSHGVQLPHLDFSFNRREGRFSVK